MIRGFYTARSGLNAHQEHMNTIANNIANVNTVGFKPMRTAFTDLMYQNLNREPENEALVGHGVKINKNDVLMAAGAYETTQRSLDFAITQENGFFALQDSFGEVYYTRDGNFHLSNDDDTFYLVGSNGEYVLDEDGEVIEVEFDEDTYEMDFDPAVIGVYTFSNPYGLSLVGVNRFIETDISGEATALEEPTLQVGVLEGSGVGIADEMTNVIEASKAFSFSSRMVQVADEVEQTINSLR